MNTISKTFEICCGHRLQNHKGKCRHLHGHNYRVEVQLCGPIEDATGMVCDFGDIKQLFQKVVDGPFDHRTILHYADPLVKALRDVAPMSLVTIHTGPPTAENLANLWRQAMANHLPGGHGIRLIVWETSTSFASTDWLYVKE